jgi:hypothetical protein
VQAAFLCWKACTLAHSIESDALQEMAAAEKLSQRAAADADRAGMHSSLPICVLTQGCMPGISDAHQRSV